MSIIIASFNQSETIEATLLSVFTQDYTNIETIIIDGGSDTNTLNIIEKYKEHIQYFISEPDEGIYDAFNKGIRLSSGDYLFFLGTDDTLEHNIISTIFKQKKFVYYDIIYGKVRNMQLNRIIGKNFSYQDLFQNNIPHQAIFYHKNIFTQFGLFETQYITRADYMLNIKWFCHPNTKIHFNNLIIANYYGNGFSYNNIDCNYWKNEKKVFIQYFSPYISSKQLKKLDARPSYKIAQQLVRTNNTRKAIPFALKATWISKSLRPLLSIFRQIIKTKFFN